MLLFVEEPLGPVRKAIFNTTWRMQKIPATPEIYEYSMWERNHFELAFTRKLFNSWIRGMLFIENSSSMGHFVGSETWTVISDCSIVVIMRREGMCRIYGISKTGPESQTRLCTG